MRSVLRIRGGDRTSRDRQSDQVANIVYPRWTVMVDYVTGYLYCMLALKWPYPRAKVISHEYLHS